MALAMAQKKALDQAANTKITNPGQIARDMRTGERLWANPAPAGYEWAGENPDGTPVWRKVGGGSGATGGTGNGPGSKTGKGDVDGHNAALDALFKTNGKDAPPELVTSAKVMADTVAQQHPGLSPNIIAKVAYDAASNPKATSKQINPVTGSIDTMYISRDIDGGRPIVVASNSGTMEDIRAATKGGIFGGDGAGKAVVSMLKSQPNEATRNLILKAASGPQGMKEAEDLLRSALPPEAQTEAINSLRRKASYVQAFPEAAKAFSTEPASQAKPGGVTPPATQKSAPGLGLNYNPPADSKAGRSQAIQAKAKQEAAARQAASAAKQAELSSQFKADAKTMSPLELSQKYQDVESSLPTSDLVILRELQKKI